MIFIKFYRRVLTIQRRNKQYKEKKYYQNTGIKLNKIRRMRKISMQRVDTDFCGILSNINFYRILAFREIWIHNVKSKYEIKMWKTTKYHLYFYSVFSLSFSRIHARWDGWATSARPTSFISRIRARWDYTSYEEFRVISPLSFPAYVRDETREPPSSSNIGMYFHFPHTCEMRR